MPPAAAVPAVAAPVLAAVPAAVVLVAAVPLVPAPPGAMVVLGAAVVLAPPVVVAEVPAWGSGTLLEPPGTVPMAGVTTGAVAPALTTPVLPPGTVTPGPGAA
ncbi:MAG: M50 family metallopeptidase, partial [Candidatus Xenobia bacterium]